MTFIYQLEDILNPNKMEKSAMQLLKERLFDVRIKQNPITYDEINGFIELEKNQLIEAYDDALGSCELLDGLEYYANKFNK